MVDPVDTPAASGWRRRPLGLAWVIAVLVVPLLLAVIGYGTAHRSQPAGLPELTEAASPPAATPPGLSVVTVTRDRDTITIQGELPSGAAKRALLDAVVVSVPEVVVVDTIDINPDVTALDFAKAGPVFAAAAKITDFGVAVSGRTVTLTGTAASEQEENAVEDAALAAWAPDVNIDDRMDIAGPVPPAPRP